MSESMKWSELHRRERRRQLVCAAAMGIATVAVAAILGHEFRVFFVALAERVAAGIGR